jgi:hypothetical protein
MQSHLVSWGKVGRGENVGQSRRIEVKSINFCFPNLSLTMSLGVKNSSRMRGAVMLNHV